MKCAANPAALFISTEEIPFRILKNGMQVHD
jgi:hypothetical protein